jgi:hypothetical protein
MLSHDLAPEAINLSLIRKKYSEAKKSNKYDHRH